MRRTLVVTTPAADTALLTIEELRAAAGVTGSAQDSVLLGIAEGVTSDIMAECNIAAGLGANEPTLLTETLTETFYDWAPRRDLVLSRRHNVAITSVAIDDSDIDSSEYVVNAEDGILSRIASTWCGAKIVVVYEAGFDEAPASLKQTAREIFSSRYSESTRDDMVKSEIIEIPGVETKRRDYWVGAVPGQASSEGPIPATLSGRLKRFRNLETSIG